MNFKTSYCVHYFWIYILSRELVFKCKSVKLGYTYQLVSGEFPFTVTCSEKIDLKNFFLWQQLTELQALHRKIRSVNVTTVMIFVNYNGFIFCVYEL